jgi:hypothetical protein
VVRHGVEQGPALSSTVDESGLTARLEWALIGIGFIAMFAVLPHNLGYDDRTRFADIEALLHHGHLSGSRYSLVGPLISAPVLLLGEIVGSPYGWAERFNVIVVAVSAAVLWRLSRGWADPRFLRWSLLLLLFASYLANRLHDYNAETLTAALITIGVVMVAKAARPWLGWVAMVIGVVNTPAAIAGLALLVVVAAVRERRLVALWPVIIAALLIMLESWIRRGGPLTTGYANDHGVETIMPYSGRPGFSYPFPYGVASILFSFGRGLVFFMPGLVLWFSARDRRMLGGSRRVVSALLLFTLGLVLVYAKWWAWYGGIAWGPRFFTLAAVPASVLLARRLLNPSDRLWDNAITLLVLGLSVWVAVAGVTATPDSLKVCGRNRYANEALCWYSPEFSPLGSPLRSFVDVQWTAWLVAALCVAVALYAAVPTVARVAAALDERRGRSARLLGGWRF